eukprot:9468025-Pyramimonas_sp.AAC.1
MKPSSEDSKVRFDSPADCLLAPYCRVSGALAPTSSRCRVLSPARAWRGPGSDSATALRAVLETLGRCVYLGC